MPTPLPPNPNIPGWVPEPPIVIETTATIVATELAGAGKTGISILEFFASFFD